MTTLPADDVTPPADPTRAVDGHWVARVDVPRTADADELAALLWLAGARGVQLHPHAVEGWFARGPDAIGDHVQGVLDAAATWRFEPARDHLAAWRASLTPIAAGPFDIVPSHRAADHAEVPGRHRIVLDPGQAFGSGHHDTTAGCLEALADEHARPAVAGSHVLDVGTGTGILAIGALLLGAVMVVGVDTDAHAIAVARRNLDDHLGDGPDAPSRGRVSLVVGSLDVVEGQFDVVVANLLTHTVVALAGGLFAATRPGGRLVASGIGRERATVAVDALRDAGFVDPLVDERGEWVVVTAGRPEERTVT